MNSSTFSRTVEGLPWWPNGKESICNVEAAGDTGSIPGSGRPLWEGHGNPLQYSCLENSMDRESGWLQSMGSQRVRHNWSDWVHTQTGLFKFWKQFIPHIGILPNLLTGWPKKLPTLSNAQSKRRLFNWLRMQCKQPNHLALVSNWIPCYLECL